VEFEGEKVVLGRVFLRVLLSFPVCIFPPLFHIPSLIDLKRYTNSVLKSVVKRHIHNRIKKSVNCVLVAQNRVQWRTVQQMKKE
jgi:hypothetical protein